jgi:hypothetical protein
VSIDPQWASAARRFVDGQAFGHPALDRWCEATETKQGGAA